MYFNTPILSKSRGFLNSKKKDPNIRGILTKKENLKADSLSKPLNKRVEIVIPEREIPGIIAKQS